ncbi:MAG: hypothetical protein HY551_01020 [Elusimicrobia bacterium]|nr:hypothetical protein [Elusimicrobiota bacterium]
MNPGDLDRELERLWGRVVETRPPGGGDAPEAPSMSLGSLAGAAGGDVASASREAAMETIALLKRRHRQQKTQWEEAQALKNEALREQTERLARVEAELAQLKREATLYDVRMMEQTSDMTIKLESAQQAMQGQSERFRADEDRLRELLDKTRAQLAAETKRWSDLEAQWTRREEQYIEELQGMRSRLAKVHEETTRESGRSRQLGDNLQEAKKAIEATLTELLAERRLREEADRERARAHERVTETSDHLKNLQAQWEEERKQWQELWDRERSTWETQRREFSVWEDRLRAEREKWHDQMKEKEGEVIRFSSQMTQMLRESSEASAHISRVLRAASGVATGIWGPHARHRAWRIAGTALAALAIAGGGFYWRHSRQMRFELSAAHSLPVENPTAIGFDGNALWIAEWSGKLVSLDPSNPAAVLAQYSLLPGGPYRPVSLALGAGALWSLDASQARIVKHRLTDPGSLELVWPSPGPGPVALAHDGRNLWSYDAVTKSLYRHLGEGPRAEAETVALNLDVVPTSMQWQGDVLWLHDGRGKRLLKLRMEGNALHLLDSQAFDSSALAVTVHRTVEGRRARHIAWALCGEGSEKFTFKKYRILP